MVRQIIWALAAAALISITSPGALHAHEGHDDGPQRPAAPVSASPRGEAHSDKFELVAMAQPDALLFYLDDYRTNAPVEEAIVEVETPDGPKTATPLGNENCARLPGPSTLPLPTGPASVVTTPEEDAFRIEWFPQSAT